MWFLVMFLQVCLRNTCRPRSTVSASTPKPSVDFTSKFYVNNRKQRGLLENAIPDRWAMAILYSNGLSVAFIEFLLPHSTAHLLIKQCSHLVTVNAVLLVVDDDIYQYDAQICPSLVQIYFLTEIRRFIINSLRQLV